MDGRSIAADVPVAPRAWAGLAVVAAAAFVVSLDTMVLYVAFGDIRRGFPGVTAASLSWILSGYTIVIAAGMIGAGRWADRLGRRRIFLVGMALFTDYLLPFEVTSVLILIAILGAIVLARKEMD